VAVDILADKTVSLSYIALNRKSVAAGTMQPFGFRLPEAAPRVKLDTDQR
jgi:hypothetical protein